MRLNSAYLIAFVFACLSICLSWILGILPFITLISLFVGFCMSLKNNHNYRNRWQGYISLILGIVSLVIYLCARGHL